MRRFESLVEIDAPVERVFDLLSDFEGYPRWMGGIRDVWRTGRRTTHWVSETALDVDVEWDAETTVFEPDRRVAWRSVRGDVHADGEAVVSETQHGTTLLRVVLGYDTPGGRTGDAVGRFFGRHPERQLDEDLAQFKRLAERGGDRRGDDRRGPRAPFVRREEGRGRADRMTERHERPREDRFGRDAAPRGWRQEGYDRRPAEGRWEDSAPRRGGEREGLGGARFGEDEAERRRRFDEALGEARRSQAESMRRYEREDREREERDRRPRYALTPRERERERAHERERERAETERRRAGWYLKRGVDRLLEEPPSGRWRGRR